MLHLHTNNGIMLDFSILEFVWFFIISLSLAELAMQIVISDLAYRIKGAILLNQPYHKRLETLISIPFWRKLLGHWWFIASPLILLIKIHKFVQELFSCPWCIAYHLCWITNWLYFDMPIFEALLLAPLGLVFVTLLDRLHTK